MTSSRTYLVAALVAFALVAAACGGGSIDVVDTPTTGSPGTTDAPAGSGDTPTGGADDREMAPNFTLSLEPEGEFVLADAGKPVYLVFWAEW